MKPFFTLVLIALFNLSFAQSERVCGTMEMLQKSLDENPGLENYMSKQEMLLQKQINEHPEQFRSNGVITIPVVVHVVYNTAVQNISETQILSQIIVMIEDFRRTNLDAANTLPVFLGVAADSEIEFCLATIDPNGDPTTGIERVETTRGSWGFENGMKYTAQGGADGWPRDQYLNMWTVNFSGGLLGFAQFPGGGPAAEDGVVMGYNFFGTSALNDGTFVLSPPFDLGRTTTHEVGHWLNLRHIWGDGPCGVDDGVADTPEQDGPSGGCPLNAMSCGSLDMVQNYMDYSNDACMNLFSQGQADRMNNAMANFPFRTSLITSNGCGSLFANDPQLTNATLNGLTGDCSTEFTPVVTIYNGGIDALTAADIEYSIDGGSTSTEPWSGNLASGESEEFALPNINVSTGPHLFEATIIVAGDEDITNNEQSLNFVSNDGTTVTMNLYNPSEAMEGFEAVDFPPENWILENPENNATWERAGVGGFGSSSASAKMDFYSPNSNTTGEFDFLSTGTFDMDALETLELSFSYAHARFQTSNDRLRVYLTDGCGSILNVLWQQSGLGLATAPDPGENEFIPTAGQWETANVDLTSSLETGIGQIVFEGLSDWGNNLYVDDINLGGTFVGITDPTSFTVGVYPSITNDQIQISIQASQTKDFAIEIINVQGQLVFAERTSSISNEEIIVDVDQFTAGLYFVRVQSGNEISTRKVIIIE